MSTPPCHTYPTKAKAIEGFCDQFPGFCEVSPSGVESVPSDVERTILFDNNPNNDRNDCDGGFVFESACPTACGTPQTTVSATYRVVADAFGGGQECPYYDGFQMEIPCPATEPCSVDCEGSWSAWSGCPSCGTTSTSHSETRSWTTTSLLPPGYSYSPACPSPTEETKNCPATDPCPADCSGGTWSYTCPTNCGYGGGNVTATLVNYTPAVGTGSCTTTKQQYCPARDPCPADCSGGTWSYTCPTHCGYGGGNVTATLVNYTPAVGTGSCTTTKQQYCPAREPCPANCEGFWTSPPCPTACGTPATTPSKTWSMTKDPIGTGWCPDKGTAPTYSCAATPKCQDTFFNYTGTVQEQFALGLSRLPNTFSMTDGYKEVVGWNDRDYFYSLTFPEFMYLNVIEYEALPEADILPVGVEWFIINPDGTWKALGMTTFSTTSTKSSNRNWINFIFGRGIKYPYTKCKGLVLKIKSMALNPNDTDRSDDADFKLKFTIQGRYAGEFANW